MNSSVKQATRQKLTQIRSVQLPRKLLLFAFLALLLAACKKGSGQSAAADYVPPDRHTLQVRTLESLWTTIDENYVYSDFHGIDWTAVHDEYLAQLEGALSDEEFTRLLETMVAELSPDEIRIQTREERLASALTDADTYEGIGSFVAVRDEPEPRILLLSVMPGSPAEAAGLQAHDAILAVDGVPVVAGEGSDAIARVRGPAGSEVTLTIHSPGLAPRDVVLSRGRISHTESGLQWEILDDTGVGYFQFPPVAYNGLIEDFVSGLQAMDADGALNALILDLRVVMSGDSWPAGALLTLFVDGTVGQFYSRSDASPVTIPGVSDFLDSQEIPVAILVGPDTSGSSEIFASVMQAQSRAVILGRSTPGSVESETLFALPNGMRASIPTSTFHTSDERELGLLGVEPDMPLDYDWDEVTPDNDPVRDAALELLLSSGS